jgi:hypothetical protein
MHAEIVTLCHSAIVQEGRLSILGAFDSLLVPSVPHRFTCSVAARIKFGTEDAGPRRITVRILDGDGRTLAQARADLTLPANLPRPIMSMNIAFGPLGLETRTMGQHAIDLIRDDAEPFFRSSFELLQQSPA